MKIKFSVVALLTLIGFNAFAEKFQIATLELLIKTGNIEAANALFATAKTEKDIKNAQDAFKDLRVKAGIAATELKAPTAAATVAVPWEDKKLTAATSEGQLREKFEHLFSTDTTSYGSQVLNAMKSAEAKKAAAKVKEVADKVK